MYAKEKINNKRFLAGRHYSSGINGLSMCAEALQSFLLTEFIRCE